MITAELGRYMYMYIYIPFVINNTFYWIIFRIIFHSRINFYFVSVVTVFPLLLGVCLQNVYEKV